MLHVSVRRYAFPVAIAVGTATPLLGQNPQWVAKFNDERLGLDRVTAVAFREGSAYLAGYNDAGWTAWKLAPDGTIQWTWRGAGLPFDQYDEQQPFVAGFDADGNLCLVAGELRGQGIAWISPDGRTVSAHRFDRGASIQAAVVTPDGGVICTGSYTDVVTFRLGPGGDIEWSATYNSPENADDAGSAIALGPRGDIYVAGSAGSYTRNTGYAALVLRYSAAGELIWDRLVEFDPAEPREAMRSTGLAVDSAGNAYVAGLRSAPNSTSQAMIFKLAPDGALAWHDDSFGRPYASQVPGRPAVLLDEPREAVYLAGDVRIDDSNSDFRVRRYSPNGVIEWTAGYDGPAHGLDYIIAAGLGENGDVDLIGTSQVTPDDSDFAVAHFDAAGNLVAVGLADDSPVDRAGAAGLDGQGNAIVIKGVNTGYVDARALRIDADGTLVWALTLGTLVGSVDLFWSAAVGSSGDVVAVGDSDRRLAESPGICVRYSSAGALQWLQRLPRFYTEPRAVFVDQNDRAVVVARYWDGQVDEMGLLTYAPDGDLVRADHYPMLFQLAYAERQVSLDPSGNVVATGWETAGSDRNAVVQSIDAAGALAWRRVITGDRRDLYLAVSVDPAGEIAAVGASRPASGTGPTDVLTARYGADGVERWVRRFAREDLTSTVPAEAVQIAADGSVWILAQAGRGSYTGPPASVLLLRYSPDGELLWARDYYAAGSTSTWPTALRFDADGNAIVLCFVEHSDRTEGFALVAYAPTGDLLWESRHGERPGNSEFVDLLAIGANDDPLVAGRSYPGTSGGSYDSFLLRADSAGDSRWSSRQTFPSDLAGRADTLLPVPDGGFIVAGTTWSYETATDGWIIRYGPPQHCEGADFCMGDLNHDCAIDLADLTSALAGFGIDPALGFAPANGDLDFDADVDLQDLALLLGNWGEDCR